MTERGLLTESEREALSGEEEGDEIARQFRNRFDSVERDITLLARQAPEIFSLLEETVEQASDEVTARDSGNVRTLGELDFPHDDERCKAAVYAARDYIRAAGTASRADIVSQVMPVHPLRYQVDAALRALEADDEYDGEWWTDVVRPGLEALPTIECPGSPDGEYRYAETE